MTTLICGSIAYDTIMVFPDQFKKHILPEQIHILNVAFLVPDMRREFGGTAGNIAYNLKLLGEEPTIMATVGNDSGAYFAHLAQHGITRQHVREIPEAFTAQAFITTDLDDNQIIAFHPGAMNFSHHNRVGDVAGVQLGIIAPDGRDGMFQHAREFSEQGIPFVFDPGQGLPMFDGEELLHFLDLADYCAVNDYEAKLLVQKTGRSIEQIATMVKGFVVTLGGKGSQIYTDGKCVDIPSVPAQALLDPTGCGDAYRAGLLYGIAHDLSWDDTGRLASLLGSIKIASRGPQNHSLTRDEIGTRFSKAFGHALW